MAGLGLGVGPMEGAPPLAPLELRAPTAGLWVLAGAGAGVGGPVAPRDEGLWGCDVDEVDDDGAPNSDGGGLGVEVMSCKNERDEKDETS